MRERSAADNFALRAFPALLAASERSVADRLAARAFPPNFPSATAFGFFLAVILSSVASRMIDVNGERERIARTSADSADFSPSLWFIVSAVSPTMRPALGCPTQSAHSAQGERKAEDQPPGCGFALEPNSPGRANALPTRQHPEPRKSVYLSTSCQRSKFGFVAQSLTGEQRLP